MEKKRPVGRPKGSKNRPKLPLPEPTPPVRISVENANKAVEAALQLGHITNFRRAFASDGTHDEVMVRIEWGNYRAEAPWRHLKDGLTAYAERLAIEIRALGVEP